MAARFSVPMAGVIGGKATLKAATDGPIRLKVGKQCVVCWRATIAIVTLWPFVTLWAFVTP